MTALDEQQIKKILMEERGFLEPAAELTARGVSNLNEDLRQAFDLWIQKGIETNTAFKNITIETIRERKQCGYLDALFAMNSYMKDPRRIERFLSIPEEILQTRRGGIKKD